jgi:hypothetical protein
MANLRREDWLYPSEYVMIKKGLSDTVVQNLMSIVTKDFPRSQIYVSTADMPPKGTLRILPFYDGLSKYSEEIQEPYVHFSRLFPDASADSDNELVRIKTINATPDDTETANNVIFNRYTGWLGSLSDEVAQLSLNYVLPWILGRERPVMPHMSVPRNQWPIVYMQNPNFLKALFDVEEDDYLLAQLYGLRSFLGPNKYLFKPQDYIRDKYSAYYRKMTDTGIEKWNEATGLQTFETGLFQILQRLNVIGG